MSLQKLHEEKRVSLGKIDDSIIALVDSQHELDQKIRGFCEKKGVLAQKFDTLIHLEGITQERKPK